MRQTDIQRWLQEEIRAGNFNDFWVNGFPKYVWHREDDIVYQGHLMDPSRGTYKGYPLEPYQFPRGL
jgi:hypothetical protein